MSATNRGAAMVASDFYPTPVGVVDKMVQLAATELPRVTSILEPSAGSGVFVRGVRQKWPYAKITAVEPELDRFNKLMELPLNIDLHQCDLEVYSSTTTKRFDLIIGNPPYTYAESHIRKCMDLLYDGGLLVFLLRLAFLESNGRRLLWEELPPKVVKVLPERPSFCASWKCKGCGMRETTESHVRKWSCPNGCTEQPGVTRTDSTAYAVFVWEKGFHGKTELCWLL